MERPAPLVSVVLPVYNGAASVGQAISSIQQQSVSDWELVIVDDGSTDGSLEICKLLAANDQRIQIFSNKTNLGLAKTMNRLVALTRGRFIAIQEQDDVSESCRLKAEVQALEAHPSVALVSGVAAWLDDQGEIQSHFPGLLHRGDQYPQNHSDMVRLLFVEQCKIVNAACMFRRELVSEISGPFDPEARLSIDWQFFVHVAHRHQILGIPRVLVRMRRGNQHQSLTRRQELKFQEARRCIRLLYDHYNKDNNSPINLSLFRKAMATELVIEGRSYSRFKGVLRLFQAVLYQPGKRQAWVSLLEICGRALRRVFQDSVL